LHADGIIGHGLFTRSWWNDVVRPALDAGTQSAGRTGPVFEHGWVITAVSDEDPARAELDARRMIAFYLTVRTYDPMVTHHGWGEPVAAIRAAFRKGDTDGMAAAVTQEMLAAIAVCGTIAAAREALAAARSLRPGEPWPDRRETAINLADLARELRGQAGGHHGRVR
jgi:5,10-methylenetetrahydromethanopterin reductase